MTDATPANNAATDVDFLFGGVPAINLVKLTNGTDNNSAPGPFVPVGSTVAFTYVVTNPGDVPLSGVTVRDNSGTPLNPADDFNATYVAGDTNSNAFLDLLETWTFTATRVATPGQYSNIATATATPINPNPPTSVERFGWKFAPGDRIMETVNDYDRDVFNGDLGSCSQPLPMPTEF